MSGFALPKPIEVIAKLLFGPRPEPEPALPANVLAAIDTYTQTVAAANASAEAVQAAVRSEMTSPTAPAPAPAPAKLPSMPKLDLVRVLSNDLATFGVLVTQNRPFAVCLEKPWRNNQPQVSCIPPGSYLCKRVNSPKFGNTFEITGVPGRFAILFHKGNTETDSLGCVLVAESFEDWQDGRPSIASSAQGFGQFLDRFSHFDEFMLTVWPATL